MQSIIIIAIIVIIISTILNSNSVFGRQKMVIENVMLVRWGLLLKNTGNEDGCQAQ